MKRITIRTAFLFLLVSVASAAAQDRPNILWLVTEDMSPYLSSYGNKLVKTPNLDELAKSGLRFTKAFSNGTQCSPSRSTIILGRYAVSMGTDYHRHPVNVADSLYFPIYLQRAGYFTVNNPKQDYNTLKTPKSIWDAQGGKADYADRPDKSRPFYAQYNQGITHMTRVAKEIDKRLPDSKREVKMSQVEIPSFIPDLPEVRDDISWNMGAVRKMDDWVGEKVAELKARGEFENTIIMFTSDHGGTVPRGKGYVYQTGTLIPLIVYFPEKWKHLAGVKLPAVSDRLVSFIDFAPTILSLAGQKIPSHMTGKPFLTEASQRKKNVNQYVFSFRTNQGGSFGPSRALHDGKYHLIWNFQTAYPNGTRQDYQWQMPAQQAWDKAFMAGKLNELHKRFWEPSPTFELYDVTKDSLEVNNLSADPKFSSVLNRLKTELEKQLHSNQDLGLIPPQYKFALQKEEDIVSIVRKQKIDVDEVIDAAVVASYKDISNLPKLLGFLSNRNPMVQYWGASGLAGLTRAGLLKEVPQSAKSLLAGGGQIEEVSLMIAEAMVYTNERDRKTGLDHMVKHLAKGSAPAGAGLQNVGKLAMPVASEIRKLLDDPKAKSKFYIRSVLINCGLLPYDDLYKLAPGESVPD